MGLDMYLDKVKRVKGVTIKQIVTINDFFNWLEEGTEYNFKEWCGKSVKDVKIDLIAPYIAEYTKKFLSWDTDKEYGRNSIFTSIHSWRKSNQIHRFFVYEVQDGKDDCGYYEVEKEILEKLRNLCHTVIESSKLVPGQVKNGYTWEDGKQIPIFEEGKYIEDPSVAQELLPTQSGFFFGSTEYDQWYYGDLVETLNVLNKVLEETDFETEMVVYSSSW